ncbi:MAG: hypothetical protein ABR507_11910 [Actinomycetota bacterium]
MIVLVAAAVTFGASCLKGGIKARWPWLIAMAGWGLAAVLIGNAVHPVWMLLFMTGSGASVYASSRRGLAAQVAYCWVGSDICLLLSLTARVASGDGWSVPHQGEWHVPLLLVIAVALRFASTILPGPDDHRFESTAGLASVAWWQGVFLLKVFGSLPAPSLVLSAAVLVGVAVALSRSERRVGPAIGGALALLLAAAGAPWGLTLAIGLAAFAFTYGERAASAWLQLAAPLGAASWLSLGRLQPFLLAIGLPVFFAALVWVLTDARAPSLGGRVLAAASIIASVAYGPHPLVTIAWLALSAAVAWLMLSLMSGQLDVRVMKHIPATHVAVPVQGSLVLARTSAPSLAGLGALAAIALLLVVRLTVIGMGTGFV